MTNFKLCILRSTVTFISLVFTLLRSSSTLLPPLSLHLPGVYTGKILLKITVSSRSPVFTLVSFCLFARDLVARPPTLLIFRLHSLLPARASNFLPVTPVTCLCMPPSVYTSELLPVCLQPFSSAQALSSQDLSVVSIQSVWKLLWLPVSYAWLDSTMP